MIYLNKNAKTFQQTREIDLCHNKVLSFCLRKGTKRQVLFIPHKKACRLNGENEFFSSKNLSRNGKIPHKHFAK
jgi:hypothetical protein